MATSIPISVDISELSDTPQTVSATPSPAQSAATHTPSAEPISVDAWELSSEPPASAPSVAAPSTPEQPLFQKHPANLEYKNIRSRESDAKIAARQNAAKDVSTGTEVAGDVLSLAGGAAGLALPTTATTLAGSTAEIAKDAMGNTVIKSVPNMVETAGKSLAEKGISATIETAKQLEQWVVKNPVKATAIETIAHELGVDPFQLASKVSSMARVSF